jgi:hypothetical protein
MGISQIFAEREGNHYCSDDIQKKASFCKNKKDV